MLDDPSRDVLILVRWPHAHAQRWDDVPIRAAVGGELRQAVGPVRAGVRIHLSSEGEARPTRGSFWDARARKLRLLLLRFLFVCGRSAPFFSLSVSWKPTYTVGPYMRYRIGQVLPVQGYFKISTSGRTHARERTREEHRLSIK